ncbi:ATP-binding cassette domain-containing protein [Pseudothauera rhizosphaerae]|uniref:ABC transporter ATP-binding protein n=1 Tax=Pseudothauera rhizosphaerae TaxID=2565932 RepID=A0A4S4AS99_9RHOO|nr:ATP-binding cassette domain-containing protein [Pseudothauera rhizosphaerae]THF62753.1 ABC transporter ATP-binding protein [Pseudothauera rhizosphaerae]
MSGALERTPLHLLLDRHPCVGDFLGALGLDAGDGQRPLGDWLRHLPDEELFDAGMAREQMLAHIQRLIGEVEDMARASRPLRSLTLLGGRDKSGQAENVELEVRAGEVVCIVGPTGSGKSRLLADIECLAQGDTPTGRRILLDGQPPGDERRYAPDRKLVAQLSQNMNFVVDLSVRDFITLHARCRMVADVEGMAEQVIACANGLTGEKFSPEVSVTQLSGGQTRALMIADAALLSASPVVLIDEIENAGVDRKRALRLLSGGDKIVLISTHDPLLALRGDRRLVIRNGGIAEVITTGDGERDNLERLETLDGLLMDVRDRLRRGLRIEDRLEWPH